MTHFTTEEWIDFANGLVAIRKRKEMDRHLEEGCSRCKKALSLWQKVRQTAKSAADYEPPEHVVRIAKAGFMGAQVEQKPSRMHRYPSGGQFMKYKNALNLFAGILLAAVALSAAPSVHAQQCSLAGVAGKWGYTYTGTIILPSPTGAVPVAAVGRFTLDADGNLSGTQTRSNGGVSAQETISAKVTMNANCTGTGTFNVYQSGVVVRSAVLALVFDDDAKELRATFESLPLSNGPTLPAVVL